MTYVPEPNERSNWAVAYRWANGTAACGRTSSGNMSFIGPTLISYATPIARIHKPKPRPVESTGRSSNVPMGGVIILITSYHWSVTTSGKHLNAMWHMLAQMGWSNNALRVPVLDPTSDGDHGMNMAYLASQYEASIDAIANVKGNKTITNWHMQAPVDCRYNLTRYARSFRLERIPPMSIQADINRAFDIHRQRVEKYNSPSAVKRRARAAAFRTFRKLCDIPSK